MNLRAIVFFTCFLTLNAFAAIDTYEFTDDESRERFQLLSEELRCPKCQNQNLADSNSPIAADLRREIYRMVQEAQTTAQIKEYMVARYGEFVLYKPPVSPMTYVLWYGPYVLLGFAACIILLLTRKKKRARQDVVHSDDENMMQKRNSETEAETREHKERMKQLLEENKND